MGSTRCRRGPPTQARARDQWCHPSCCCTQDALGRRQHKRLKQQQKQLQLEGAQKKQDAAQGLPFVRLSTGVHLLDPGAAAEQASAKAREQVRVRTRACVCRGVHVCLFVCVCVCVCARVHMWVQVCKEQQPATEWTTRCICLLAARAAWAWPPSACSATSNFTTTHARVCTQTSRHIHTLSVTYTHFPTQAHLPSHYRQRRVQAQRAHGCWTPRPCSPSPSWCSASWCPRGL